ncbi:XkdF-like putative serine protease domain-containing protein [Cytobacillus sp. NCCP-133]|uniref:XkdF-like putative serine protease domain-containing protein n=1 Tax=Cytobacillus sp. NCCP-133 TaxID=766848 RepID=UPI002231B2DD|nr:XkdF-like putative serine protease domain-containing protein [Cytobacillus sp. NCCP-133]GLB58670.1 hypothetical protein NCCP133_08030 [Cytobacillus sp. NCCP-133]
MEKRIVYAPVLIPDRPDSDGDVVTAEQIESWSHEFMALYRNVDLQHTLNNTAVPVESYILKEDKVVESFGKQISLPIGTWVMAVKVLSDEVWQKIKEGHYTGFSIMAVKRTVMDEVSAKGKEVEIPEAAIKRTTLKDLGTDLAVVFVSIVDEPAVPDATFFAFKSKEDTWFDRLKNAFSKTAKKSSEGVKKEEDTMTPEQFEQLLAAVGAINTRLDALESSSTEEVVKAEGEEEEVVEEVVEETPAEEVPAEETPEEEVPAEETEEEDAEALKAQIAELQSQLTQATKARSKKLVPQVTTEPTVVSKSKFTRDASGRRL